MPKSHSIIIHLPEPCNENWDEMKPNGCGRFCTHCEKMVIDFTRMSDDEVVKIMTNATNIPCGRFDERQLNRPLLIPQTKTAKPFPYLFSKVAASFLLVQTLVSNVFAQKNVQAGMERVSSSASAQKRNQVIIQGSIKDNTTSEPLIGMEISIPGLNYVKYSDVEGHFRFVLPDSFKGKKIVVSAKYQQSSSKKLDNTMIQEEEILIPLDADVIAVQLVRYPYQELDKVVIETSYLPPMKHTLVGGTPSFEENTSKKSSFKVRLHNLFKKKK